MFAACQKTEVSQESQNGPLQSILVNVESFGSDNGTKTAVTPSGTFTWSAGDQIGIYPVASTLGAEQTSQQIVFKINGTGDASSATFTGTGWGLITDGNYKYFSYYPYSASAKYNEAAVTFTGNLNQESNTATAHLGVNDYLYAPQIQPEAGSSAVFTFKHLSALVEFEVKVPDDVKTKKFTRMVVTASDSVFTTSGKYDPSSATASAAPAITENVFTDMLNIKFNNGAGFTPDENGKLHAYFLIAPAAVSDKTLSIKLYDKDNIPYIATKTPSSDIKAQDHKIYECVATVNPMDVATNLSADGTANCYVVPEMGRYKFLANVRGNGVDPVPTDSEGAGIDMSGCTAEIIWETVNTNVAPAVGAIVSNATVEGNFIVFDATGAEGNALIALKNGSDEIVWSWHIWSTMADLDGLAQTYPNNAGVMMDRNLGALSATPGDGLTLGFLYQWGRPFPITGGSSTAGKIDATRMATTGTELYPWVEEETDAIKGTLAYSAANPTHFIYASASNFLKGTSTVSGNWLWTANDYATADSMPAFWGDAKTMYDPSPIGWKVPKGGSTGVWSTAGFSISNFIWNATEKGNTFNSPAAYYPAAGYRGSGVTVQGGALLSIGINGFYWSSSVTGVNGYDLNFSGGSVSPSGSYVRAFGFFVRPCQE